MQAVCDHANELCAVVREAAAETAHGEARANNERVAEVFCKFNRLVDRVGDVAARDIGSGIEHELLEDLAIFALVDRLEVRADQLDVVLLENPVLVQIDRGVERGLAAKRRKNRIGLLLCDDRLNHLPGDRLDVGRIGEVRIGHDGGRVRVHQDHPHALLTQHAARLGARVVELAGLADDDRAGADDENALYVVALWH